MISFASILKRSFDHYQSLSIPWKFGYLNLIYIIGSGIYLAITPIDSFLDVTPEQKSAMTPKQLVDYDRIIQMRNNDNYRRRFETWIPHNFLKSYSFSLYQYYNTPEEITYTQRIFYHAIINNNIKMLKGITPKVEKFFSKSKPIESSVYELYSHVPDFLNKEENRLGDIYTESFDNYDDTVAIATVKYATQNDILDYIFRTYYRSIHDTDMIDYSSICKCSGDKFTGNPLFSKPLIYYSIKNKNMHSTRYLLKNHARTNYIDVKYSPNNEEYIYAEKDVLYDEELFSSIVRYKLLDTTSWSRKRDMDTLISFFKISPTRKNEIIRNIQMEENRDRTNSMELDVVVQRSERE